MTAVHTGFCKLDDLIWHSDVKTEGEKQKPDSVAGVKWISNDPLFIESQEIYFLCLKHNTGKNRLCPKSELLCYKLKC